MCSNSVYISTGIVLREQLQVALHIVNTTVLLRDYDNSQQAP
jgi:hypothetical protein